MSITTVPGATDLCLCGHNGTMHDASQVCRYKNDVVAPCGCQSFGYPGTMGNHPPVTNAPALSGNRNL